MNKAGRRIKEVLVTAGLCGLSSAFKLVEAVAHQLRRDLSR